jgi:uncharacterized protein
MKSLKTVLAAWAITAVAATGAAHAEELRIGTASQGGAFYPMGQAIASLIGKHASGLTAVPIVTQGSVENPVLLSKGEIDLGITNNDLAYLASRGEGPYAKAGKMSLQGIGSLHPSVQHMFTLAGSSINKFQDLKGKRVAVGPAAGGTMNILKHLLEIHGMALTDVTPTFGSYNDGFSQLGDGNVDAAFALAGYPTAAVTQTQATNQLKSLKIDDDKLKALVAKYPFYSRVTVPAAVYKLAEPAVVVGVNNMLIVKAGMDADRVYKITKAIYGNLDELAANNANGKQIVPEDSMQMTIPLHPGAQKYFKERFPGK